MGVIRNMNKCFVFMSLYFCDLIINSGIVELSVYVNKEFIVCINIRVIYKYFFIFFLFVIVYKYL